MAKRKKEMTKSQLPTPIKLNVLDRHLSGFDEDNRKLLREGFRYGFRVFYQGEDCALDCKNSKSALLNPEAVTAKLEQEMAKGRVAGPFQKSLLTRICLSVLL